MRLQVNIIINDNIDGKIQVKNVLVKASEMEEIVEFGGNEHQIVALAFPQSLISQEIAYLLHSMLA